MANVFGFSTNEARTYGLAKVRVRGDAVKVTFIDGGAPFKFHKDDLPKRPRLLDDSEDTYNVVLSADKDTIEKISPAEGRVTAHLLDFWRPEEGADPEPADDTYETPEGKTIVRQKFVAVFEVTDGKYKGVTIPHFLKYLFEDDNNGMVKFKGNPQARNAVHLPRLLDFCDKTGMVEEPMEWPEDGNVLPALLERGLNADRTVELIIKKGFVAEILAADYEEAEDEEPEEVKPAPKKPVAKAAAKPAAKSKKSTDDDDDDM
jgi:hypothetical protein